jgi:hypothetical protein
MSRNSPRQNYLQLREWLETVTRPKQSTKASSSPLYSRLDYYEQKGN